MYKSIEKKYALKTSDFTPDKTIRAQAILELFQDVAGYHAEFLGCGVDALMSKGYAWILAGIRYKVVKPFKMHASVTVKTWPLKPSYAKFQREYEIFNDDGEMICIGDALWTVINFKERRIAPLHDIYQGIDEFLDEKTFAERFSRTKVDDEELQYLGERKVLISDIDVNGHVNNAKYPTFVVDVCGNDVEKYPLVHIDYNKELLLGETVTLYGKKEENRFVIKGLKNNDCAFFAEYKNA